ncbi:S-layer homology domain-containing protein [Thalassobacillus sp. CUG 92003]|uniref:S-layer homology domain-containing protein n=1 Tax=Thalassobacillus sp. CUG 92003 TaxID=2736641 RepID=UPI0015E77F92|nr:S-layer homology domain-containing protein [Thalassobacillus sp. CUG 92003]
MKKLIILCLGLLLSISYAIPSAHAKDDISGSPFEEDMRALIEADIMEGFNDGTFRPENNVTRAQFTTFVVRALDLQLSEESVGEIASSEDNQYSDVSPERWYYPYVVAASEEGVIDGYPDGTFQPEGKIERQDMAMIMMNAAELKGVVSSKDSTYQFEDRNKIGSYAVEAVKRLTSLEVINGKKIDGKLYFAPKDNTTRGETAAVINRLLTVLDPPEEDHPYSVASISEEKDPVIHGRYDTYDKAVQNASGEQVVLKGNNIVWINNGKGVSNAFTNLYNTKNFSTAPTYMTSGVELKLLDIGEDWAQVRLNDTEGYVRLSKVNLVPDHMEKDRSHYYVDNGDLYHRIYNPITESAAVYQYGKAPSFLKSDRKYYSENGHTFFNNNGNKAGEAYQYFNQMPLYTETSYTGDQLDEFIQSEQPNSPLVGTGDDFKKAEQQHGTNALYLLAHAIHESNWGKSKIAQDKNNLFGIGANDGNPYEDAWEYESFEEGILAAAEQFIVPGYFENTWKSYGAHLGNKSTGMNVKYASDVYWGQKIAGHMYRADEYLSDQYGSTPELGQYDLAKTLKSNTNVRASATATASNKLYSLDRTGSNVQILDTIETDSEGTWYEVAPKNINVYQDQNDEWVVDVIDLGKAHVYSHGDSYYGTNMDKLSIAK